jgi:hypothetical protein
MMSLMLLKKGSTKMKTDVAGSESVILDRYVLGLNDQPAWKRQLADSRGRPAQIDDDQAELYPAGTGSAVSQM